MTINFFCQALPLNKGLCFFIIFVLIVQLSVAQQMDMHDTATSKIPTNLFLGMMHTMMAKMDHAPAGETVGSQFMLEMIPHHEGAIEMSKYEILYGKDFGMIQLAKSILSEQTNEVHQMQIWLQKWLTDTTKVTRLFRGTFDEPMMIMMHNMPLDHMLTDNDHAFAAVMIPHHQAAIDMAKVVIKFTKDQQTIAFAKHIISAEQIEIEQMSQFLKH